MGWLSILTAILGFLSSLKKNPGDKGKAVAIGALAGLGTYYVSHETEWGRDNLGQFDGVVPSPPVAASDSTAIVAPDGSKIPTGSTAAPSPLTGATSGIWSVIKDVGAAGAATAVGVTAVGALTNWKSWLPWLLGGLVLYKVVTK